MTGWRGQLACCFGVGWVSVVEIGVVALALGLGVVCGW